MKGQAFLTNELVGISDKDLGEYGITLIRGWREVLKGFLKPKTYISNTSRLENGKRITIPTLDVVKYENCEISIQMMLEGSTADDYLNKLDSFQEAIRGIIKLRVPCLKNRVYTLVYSDCSKYGDYGDKKGIFTLKLTEPNPMNRTEETE